MNALTCALAAVLLSSSGPGQSLEMTVQDDALLLHRPAAEVHRATKALAAMGADRVRLTAGWGDLAPAPRSRHRPKAPFDPTDPATYPADGFRRLDVAVRAARKAGLEVQIDVAFWAPRWAVRRPTRSRIAARQRYRPDPVAFGQFASAVARRYSGAFPDPLAPKKALPAVRLWTTWNEPNHPSFLQPQWRRTASGRWRPASPHVYRRMHVRAYDALKAVDPANRVLIGGTAMTGSYRPGAGGVPPLRFLRELACVNTGLRPLRVRECRDFQPLRADGWAHHPYTRHTTPDTPAPAGRPDDAPLAATPRLAALLRALHDRGRIAQPLPIFHTEYGYESNPPDPYAPFGPEDVARFHGHATYLAWRDPDTRMFAQFLFRDIDPRESGRPERTPGHWRDWQSGLEYPDGRPKPLLQAFRTPFWAERRDTSAGPATVMFGQVRPGQGRQVVRIERLDPRTGAWVALPTLGEATCGQARDEFLTDRGGAFLRTAPEAPGEVRFSWRRPDGRWESSVPVDPRTPV